MTTLSGKSVLLIIGGGIAAYKALELIRLLKTRGCGVKTIMTRAAEEFVTPLSVASLSGEKVHTALFNLTDEIEMGHIELVARRRSARRRSRHRRSNGQDGDGPGRRSCLDRPSRHRQAGADCARHECADVDPCGDPAQSRGSCKPTALPLSAPMTAKWPAANLAPAAWRSPWRFSPPSKRSWRPQPARWPARKW